MDPKDISLIIKALRKCSLTTSGRKKALRQSRKLVNEGKTKSGKDKDKYHWQCAKCLSWFRSEKDVEVDHIKELGPFGGSWDDYIFRLIFDHENLQVLCSPCHLKKTLAYNSAASRFKRKPK